MTSSVILIPARHGSTRFPGKPLVELNGVPMIKRVYDICKSTGIDTFVLTDDQQIYNVIGPNCIIDHEEYDNGTERCAGAINKFEVLADYKRIVNVQGDMPDVTLQIIERAFEWLKHYPISTVFTDMPEEMQSDPSSVKLIRAGDQCLWFGRGLTGYGDWHLGVYGYKRHALNMYRNLPIEKEEKIEKLEQLRWLKSGWQIGCSSVYFNGTEINTPEDLKIWHNKNFQ